MKLNFSDVFYREAFGPMYLMDFQHFNKLIDDFLEQLAFESKNKEEQIWGPKIDAEQVDKELVPFDSFVAFMENSKYFKSYV